MGKLRKTLALATLAGLVVPPIAAAIAKERIVPVDDEEADEVCLVTIFDGGRFISRSTAFRGGTALCWYGGLDIDLREARLDPAGARLRLRSLFGGVRVVVPEGWQVRVRSTPIMGGVDDDTGGGDAAGPTLDVDALTAFGGVRVTSRVGDDDELIPAPVSAPSPEDEGDDRAEVLARAEAEADAEAAASAGAPAEAEADAEPVVEAPSDEVGPSGSNGS